MLKYVYLLVASLWGISASFAQTIYEKNHQLHIKKATEKIKVDGILDEPDWEKAEKTTPFNQQFPYDTSLAIQQTVARLTFDEQNIYVSQICYQPRGYRVQSLKRDFPQGGGTELVFVNFDTFSDKQNAFHFAVSPYGVQREALIFNGNDLTTDWDCKWTTVVKNYDDYWVVESAIPFKSLRYRPEDRTWNINFYRNNLHLNERSSWTKMPRGYRGNDVAFGGTLVWDDAPPKQGANIVLIPYITAGVSQDFINQQPLARTSGLGLDAKIAVTSSLNLDLTVNPDFSQVEVDRQVTNLSRFELLFPERRQFFIENSDLFGSFGTQQLNPFFSRRIGITKNPITGLNEQVKIVAGARLSGKINEKLRIGFMNMQTAQNEAINLPSSNYTVAAVQQKVFTRSNVSFLAVNKQNFLQENQNLPAYHRILGFDFNQLSKNGRWVNKYYYHQAFTPTKLVGLATAGINFSLESPKWLMESNNYLVGENYTAEVGYVPRNNFIRNATFAQYNFYPTKAKISKTLNSWSLGLDWDIIKRKTDGLLTDWDGTPLYVLFRFRNNSFVRLIPFRNDYTYLFSDFDPTNTNGKKLSAGTSYHYQSTRFFYQSNNASLFFYNFQGRFGEYFNGKIAALTGTFNYRAIPYALFSVDVNYNKISLPTDYNSTQLWLVSPRAEITFSKKIFLTTFVQYNNQANNVNINTRLQWRFKPVSDFFVVYSDNYFATDPDSPYQLGMLGSKSRALVFKLTYWLNV